MGQEHDDYGETGNRPSRWHLRRIVVGIVLLVVAYVISYAALLDPAEWGYGGLHRMIVGRDPAYRAGGEFADTAFRPALWVDQHVRPDYWATHEVRSTSFTHVDPIVFLPTDESP
jgi:hypothetical protein